MTGEPTNDLIERLRVELVDLIPPGEAIVFSREGYSLRQIDALAARVTELEERNAIYVKALEAIEHPRWQQPGYARVLAQDALVEADGLALAASGEGDATEGSQ
jgi:hypothetical protein